MSEQKLVIKNIGQILSGKLEEPLIDGDCVIAIDGRITAIGRYADLDTCLLYTSPSPRDA